MKKRKIKILQKIIDKQVKEIERLSLENYKLKEKNVDLEVKVELKKNTNDIYEKAKALIIQLNKSINEYSTLNEGLKIEINKYKQLNTELINLKSKYKNKMKDVMKSSRKFL